MEKTCSEASETVEINTGYVCNCRCKFCSVSEAIEEGCGFRKKGKILKEIEEAERKGAKNIAFLGGEPTLRDDIFEIVSFADEKGFDMVMVETNGTMLYYKDFCRGIIESGANFFLISAQGHQSSLHNQLMGLEGAFRYMKEGIRNLINLEPGMEVHTETVLMRPNYRHLEDIADFLIDLGVKHLHFVSLIPDGRAAKNYRELAPKFSEVAGYLHKVLDKSSGGEDLDFSIRNIPHCFMERYREFLDLEENLEFWDENKKIEESDMIDKKTKPEKCNSCKYDSVCGGVWKKYAEEFGFEELTPQTKE